MSVAVEATGAKTGSEVGAGAAAGAAAVVGATAGGAAAGAAAAAAESMSALTDSEAPSAAAGVALLINPIISIPDPDTSPNRQTRERESKKRRKICVKVTEKESFNSVCG